MAKFTADIPEANLAGAGRVPPAPPSGVAEGIVDLAALATSVGTKIATDKRVGELESDLMAEQEAFFGEDPDLNPQEQQVVQRFDQKIAQISAGQQQTTRTDQFRLRAEAILKKHINEHPGLADKFRQRASGVLGFDASGQAFKIAVEDEQAAEAERLRQRQALDKDAQVLLGFAPGEMEGNPQKQQQYLEAVKIRQEIMRNEQMKALRASDPDLVTPEMMEKNLLKSIGAQRAHHSNQATAVVKAGFMELGLTPEELKNLDAEGLAGIPRDRLNLVRTALTQAQQASIDAAQAFRADFTNEANFNAYLDSVSAPYDEYFAVLDGTRSMKEIEDRAKLSSAAITGELLNTKEGQFVLAMNNWNIKVPESIVADLNVKALTMPATVFTEEMQMPSPATQKEMTKKESRILADQIRVAIDDAYFGDNASPEKQEVVSQAFLNMADMFAEGQSFSKPVLDEYVRLLRDPESANMINAVLRDNPSIGKSVREGLREHAKKLAVGGFAQLEGMVSEGFLPVKGVGPGRRERVNILKPVIDSSGMLSVEVDEEALKRTAATPEEAEEIARSARQRGVVSTTARTNPRAVQRTRKAQQNLVNSLNHTVSAMTNVFDISREQAWQDLLKGTDLGERLFPVEDQQGGEE